ncbi:MAG: outer membrane lipoprotein carrier protein LolA [Syntrophaceae bacterium]|nr:outer membrane lipoprotein carrier protein LolA [Syntrophaceae bacterium]
MVLIYLLSSASGAGAISLEDLLSQVEGQYEKTRDFQADFSQETFLKSMGTTEREKGLLYYKKPRKMLWLYEKPQAKTLVVNTEKSWLYLPDDRVVYMRKTDQLIQSTVAVRLLSGLSGIRDDFQVKFLKSDKVDEKGKYVLQLIPREPSSGFTRAQIEIEAATYNITQVWFEDAYGNATRVNLTNIKLNQELPDRKFLFVPPAGVEIFSLP